MPETTAIRTPRAAGEIMERVGLELWDKSIAGAALVAIDGTFLRANEGYQRILGRTEAELQGLTFQQVTDPQDVSYDEESAKRVAEGHLVGYDMEKRYITKRGTVVWVLLRVTAVRGEPGINGKRPFLCFLAQATKLGASPSPPGNGLEVPQQVKMQMFLQRYWQQIVWVLMGLAALGHAILGG